MPLDDGEYILLQMRGEYRHDPIKRRAADVAIREWKNTQPDTLDNSDVHKDFLKRRTAEIELALDTQAKSKEPRRTESVPLMPGSRLMVGSKPAAQQMPVSGLRYAKENQYTPDNRGMSRVLTREEFRRRDSSNWDIKPPSDVPVSVSAPRPIRR